eukprot:4937879-Amphidinium_carterae.1
MDRGKLELLEGPSPGNKSLHDGGPWHAMQEQEVITRDAKLGCHRSEHDAKLSVLLHTRVGVARRCYRGRLSPRSAQHD